MKAKMHVIISSGISIIKRHYFILILAPLYLHITWILVAALNHYRVVPIVVRIIALTYMVILISYIILLVKYVWKKQRFVAIYCLFVSISTFSVFKYIRNNNGIDDEGIDYYLKQKEYRKMIEEAPSRNKPGEPKLVIIEITPLYVCSTRYLIYDESDKMVNKENHYYGIGWNYATRSNGEKIHSSDREVSVRKYEKHIYIADTYPVDFWGASPCQEP